MSGSTMRIVILASLAVLTGATGIRLTLARRPYGVALSTTHKLLSLLTGAVWAFTVYSSQRGHGLGARDIVVIGAAGFLFVLALASGALLLSSRASSAVVLAAHRLTPPLTLIAAIAAIVLR